MKILFIGDVVASGGCDFLKENLWNIRKQTGVDMVIANGENSADGNGTLPFSADNLFTSGVDVITGGNHSFKRREYYSYLDDKQYAIRPYNFPDGAPGNGYCIFDTGRAKVAVINLIGLCYMDFMDCPFNAADKLLNKLEDETNIIIIDFHAEATSEKRALAEYVCGRASAVLGTHTHVATADEMIIGSHTGFITDVGMTGAKDSILGVEKQKVIERFITHLPTRFKEAKGAVELNGVILDIDEKDGKCVNIERISR